MSPPATAVSAQARDDPMSLETPSLYDQSVGGRPSTHDPPSYDRAQSPTPSELEEMNEPLYDFKTWRRKEHWLRWKLVPWYLVGALLIACVTMLTVFSKDIVDFIKPAAVWLRTEADPAGWLIPVAIFFVLSFPPLFGHNILAIVCGVVWGVWIGFGITCAGTLLGEIGNYYAFKHCCRGRAEKLERDRPYYACLSRVVREGGFTIALVARYSALPSHFITAVFSTCGMRLIPFVLAAVLSLPKQFVSVYIGVIIQQSGSDSNKHQHIASDVFAAVMVLLTIGSLWYLNRQLTRVKPQVMLERRRARLARIRAGVETSEIERMSVREPETALISV